MLSRFFLFLDNSGISLYFSVKIGRIIPLKSPSASIPSKICDDTKKFDEFVNVNKTVLTEKKSAYLSYPGEIRIFRSQ